MWLLLAAGGALIVVAAIVFFGKRSAPDPRSVGCESGSEPSPHGAPTRASIGPVVRLAESWAEDVALPRIPEAALLHDVAAVEGRFTAVGRTEGPTWRGLIAVSEDGRAWRWVSDAAPLFENADIVDVAAGGPGLVAVGSVSTDDRGGSAGAVWRSADGEHWQRSPLRQGMYITRVAARDGEIGAIGSSADGQPLLGFSDDAVEWEWQTWTSGSLGDLAAIEDEWLAVGSTGAGGNGLPTVWRSTDGRSWSCQALETQPDTPFGMASRALPGARSTLVIGDIHASCPPNASCAAFPTVWFAREDGTWSRTDPTSGAPTGAAPVTIAPDGGFVAVDADGVSTSMDGETWERVVEAAPPGGGAEAAAIGPGGLVAVGANHEGPATSPWIGLVPARP